MRVARFAGLLALAVACSTGVAVGGQTTVCTLNFSTGQTLYSVPIAASLAEQERGLSKTYDVSRGMLFTWPQAEPRTFWMRDTWVALDIGFFDANATLFAIKSMTPNNDTRYHSITPARYALELAQGQYAQQNIGIGSRIVNVACLK